MERPVLRRWYLDIEEEKLEPGVVVLHLLNKPTVHTSSIFIYRVIEYNMKTGQDLLDIHHLTVGGYSKQCVSH